MATDNKTANDVFEEGKTYFCNIEDKGGMKYTNKYGLIDIETYKFKIVKMTKCYITFKEVDDRKELKKKIILNEYNKEYYIKFNDFKFFYFNNVLNAEEFKVYCKEQIKKQNNNSNADNDNNNDEDDNDNTEDDDDNNDNEDNEDNEDTDDDEDDDKENLRRIEYRYNKKEHVINVLTDDYIEDYLSTMKEYMTYEDKKRLKNRLNDLMLDVLINNDDNDDNDDDEDNEDTDDDDDDDNVVVRDERHLKIPTDADGCFDKDFLQKIYDEIFDENKIYGNPKKYSMKKLYDEYGIYCFYLDKDFIYSLNKPYLNKYNQFCFDPTEYDEKDCEYIF